MVSKTVLIAAGLLSAVAVAAMVYHFSHSQVVEDIEKEFNEWKLKHGKAYFGNEHNTRLQTFKTNKGRVIAHNKRYDAGLETYYLGLNGMADISDAERKQMLGTKPSLQTNIVTLDESTTPSSVNWVTAGAVTPVKNQGSCGSCWAFSATGSLEGLHFIKKGTLQSYSEQELVDCSTSYGNQGCNGGLMDYAFQYVKAKGEELETSYAYTGTDGTCKYSASEAVFSNTGYADVTPKSGSQLKAAIAKQPVSIAIEADSFFFQLYSGGVFSYSGCGTTLDHGVLAAGYETSGTPYYLVKNSWGASWGDAGYIKIADNAPTGAGVCGLQLQPSYPTYSS